MARAKQKEAPVETEEKEAKDKGPRKHPQADQVITLLVDYNPKRANSASHERFENYEDGMTVQEAIDAGVTSGDIAWDVAHDFIVLGDKVQKVAKRSKPEPAPKAEKEDKPKAKRGKKDPEPEEAEEVEVEEEEEEEEEEAPKPRRRRGK